MTDRDFSHALLHGQDINLEFITARVLQRDRRRMLFLGILCVISWMLVVMLPWSTTLPMLAKVAEHEAHLKRDTAFDTAPPTTLPSIGAPIPIDRDQTIRLLQIVKKGTIATFIGSLFSMFIAAVCTVSLIILSRRATLRQVNARLSEISTQLKLLTRDAK